MIHEISLPFVIRQAKNRRHAYYTMVEMGTNWLNKKKMSPNSLTKGLKDTGHPMKQKIGIQHLLKIIHEISLHFVIREAKK